MDDLRIILCERSSRWATALTGMLGDEVRLRQTRSLAECRRELVLTPTSLVAVELTASNVAEVLELVQLVRQRFAATGSVVLADETLQPLAAVLAEAGVWQFVAGPRRLRPLVELVRRHRSRLPARRLDPYHRILETLPWGDRSVTTA